MYHSFPELLEESALSSFLLLLDHLLSRLFHLVSRFPLPWIQIR